MATTTNIKDAGWFCHAPNKQKPAMDFALPPTSQIPGLSEFPENYPPAEPRKNIFRDTDTKYITLCKMGGRSDLLRIPSPKERPVEAKAYPTVDWFYLEDIRKEEQEKKLAEQNGYHYQPLLPDYMVHKEYAPKGDSAYQRGRNLLSKDDTTVFQREGYQATDKTMKIQEARPSGYGVRNEKGKDKHVSGPPMPKYERAKGPTSELDADKPKVRTMKMPKEEDKPLMSKILSFGYQRDWENEHDQWQKQQEDLMRKQHEAIMHPSKQEKQVSEYQSQMNSRERVPSHGRRAPSGGSVSSNHRRQKSHQEQQPPAIFDLPKYDKAQKKDMEPITPMKYDPTKNLSSLKKY